MIGRKNYRVKVFNLRLPNDVQELELIKQKSLIDRVSGYAIMSQKEFSDKYGNVFVFLEWTEGVGL